jgi:hypothetical protein
MAYTKTKIVVLMVVIIIIAFVAYKVSMDLKAKSSNKKVTFDKPDFVETADVEQKQVDDITEGLPSIPIANDELFLMPNSSIGVSTRDGRVKNIDIRGTPPVTVSEKGPIWNLGSNRLAPRQTNSFGI